MRICSDPRRLLLYSTFDAALLDPDCRSWSTVSGRMHIVASMIYGRLAGNGARNPEFYSQTARVQLGSRLARNRARQQC
jgi:hypothetical protein